MHDVILEAKGIQKAFGGVMAVAGVDLTIQRGEVFALIGPNGAGKTTMFNLLSGAHPLDRGQIVFDGQPIHGLACHRIAARGLGPPKNGAPAITRWGSWRWSDWKREPTPWRAACLSASSACWKSRARSPRNRN